jgi:hypothetical protein
MITTRAESVQAEQLGQMVLHWKAIGWRDEKDPQSPSTNKAQFGLIPDIPRL